MIAKNRTAAEKNTNTVAAESKTNDEVIRKLVFAGVFAAITYVVFTFLSIRVPTPGGGQVSIHLGNAFVVLGALLLGGMYGGIGGAIGLTIADLIDPVYIVQAPITFVIKLCIGLLTGFIAHRLGHITTETSRSKVLHRVIAASVAGLSFNAIFDPLLRYFYKLLVLGKPAAELSLTINFAVTLLNSVVSVFITVILYMALRVPLKKVGLFFTFR